MTKKAALIPGAAGKIPVKSGESDSPSGASQH